MPRLGAATVETRCCCRPTRSIYDGDGQTVSAVGHVEIDDQGRILHADNVTYDQKNDKVTADGHVSVTDDDGQCRFRRSCRAHRSYARRRAERLRRPDRQEWPAGRRQRPARRDRWSSPTDAVYSPARSATSRASARLCGRSNPSRWSTTSQAPHPFQRCDAWIFSACRCSTRPYLTEPDPSVRYASGLLAPDFGTSTKIGYFIRAPVYVALSDSNDLTMAPHDLHPRRRNGGRRIPPALEQ